MDYFQKYKYIQQDLSAKSLSFRLKHRFNHISNDMINELIQIGTSLDQQIRLVLNSSIYDDLHNMIIFMPKNFEANIHKHILKTETYHIIKGRMKIKFFDTNGNIEQELYLSSDENLICQINANRYHTQEILSDYVVFHESRKGPFIHNDTILANWN